METLSASDLRRMLTGDLRNWPDASPVVVIEQPEASATQQQVLRILFRTTPAGYRRLLLAIQFQGKDLPLLKILSSDESAIKFVWNVPGAIAVVDAAAAASAISRVKILRLDGRLPGEARYLLQ